ncbi:MAG: hypothetical protein QXF09_03225 [Nitrososphaerota archaeon]
MAEKIPSWIERILLPKLSEITGEIKAINARIDSLEKTFNERFISLRNEMISRFESINIRIDSLEKKDF